MKQVIQSRRTGELALKNVPEPKVRAGHLLVRTRASLISAGTERMVIDFARKSLAGKAKARPDLVKKVVDKAKRDGLKATFQTVMARLDEPLPLGYSAAGEVMAVGAGLEGRFRVGERVAVAGAGLANHAELNVVPESLATSIPEGVTDAEAAFGTLGAIALHAVRNLEVALGDVVVVIGMGLVGQLAAQFLKLSGARAVALDYDARRLELAAELGAETICNLGTDEAAETIRALTQGRGADAVLIAAATPSSEPFATAADIARDRARVVMVGLTGTEFPYGEFMKKELSLIVSRSYGPGRYDPDFEGRGVKYPEGWVRWTETENLAESVRLMGEAAGRGLYVGALITHRFPFADAERAYEMISSGDEPHMGVILEYDGEGTREPALPAITAGKRPGAGNPVIGVIGAGNFAKSVLLPELKRIKGAILDTLVTQRGASADHGRESFGFRNAATDVEVVFDNPDINAVVIATRHDSHAELTARALKAGKAVLVEKPLALDRSQLREVVDARNGLAPDSPAFFQVGFNRRFAPMALKAREMLANAGQPNVMVLRVNAGAVPGEHWVQSADEGGGRILGEVCHFVDLARFFAAAPIVSVQAEAARTGSTSCEDITVSLGFADGSLATIVYTALGDPKAGKERFEIFCGGRSAVIENFRRLTITGPGVGKPEKTHQDKGFAGALAAFTDAVRGGGPAPIDEAELVETSGATISVLESLRTGGRIDL